VEILHASKNQGVNDCHSVIHVSMTDINITDINIAELYQFINVIHDFYKTTNTFLEQVDTAINHETVVNAKLVQVYEFVSDTKNIEEEESRIESQDSEIKEKSNALSGIRAENIVKANDIALVYNEKKQIIASVYDKMSAVKAAINSVRFDAFPIGKFVLFIKDVESRMGMPLAIQPSHTLPVDFAIESQNKLVYIGRDQVNVVVQFEVIATNTSPLDYATQFKITHSNKDEYMLSGVLKTVRIPMNSNDYITFSSNTETTTFIKSLVVSVVCKPS